MLDHDVRSLNNALYASGHALLEAEPSRAIAVFHLLARLAPGDERGWLGIGACHEALDAADAALSVYTLGQGVARSARCTAARARVLARQGQSDDASEVLEHALSLHWDDDSLELLERERERLT